MRSEPIKWFALLVMLAMLVLSGDARAEWLVRDQTTHTKLDQLNKDANKRLDQLRNQQNIGRVQESTGEDPQQPTLLLDTDTLSAVMESEQYGEEIRCPKPRSDAKGPMHQWQICKEIVKTELAKYQYALAMRELVIRRQQRLRSIENDRARLKDDDTGRLHSNNNELLALQARLEVDRQQYRTYMDAYDARIDYLGALRLELGNRVVNGASPSKLQEAVTGGGVLIALKTALNLQRSKKNGLINE